MKKLLSLALMGLMLSAPAMATEEFMVSKIKNLLVTSDGRFGNCMVELYVSPSSKLASCKAGWVSFSCSGTFAAKSDAKGMMDMAQLAFLLEKEVNIGVDDSKLHNGFCLSTYIAILQ